MQANKEILKNIKKIEIKTRYLVDGLLQGAFHSIFKGRGIEFSEVREYVVGDDIRSIDWNVTARMNHPYVKEFIEERDLNIYILFDVSGSGDYGTQKSKKEAAIELSASLMFAALRNNDKVGLALFTNGVERFVPSRKGKKHVLRLIREMLYYKPKDRTTNIETTLNFISKVVKKRSIMFIISDFMSDDFSRALKLLKNKHDIIAINIHDIRELELPDVGYIELEDEETGEQMMVDTSDIEFREEYSRLSLKRIRSIREKLKRMKIDIINIKNDEPFEVPLRQFFKQRIRRTANSL